MYAIVYMSIRLICTDEFLFITNSVNVEAAANKYLDCFAQLWPSDIRVVGDSVRLSSFVSNYIDIKVHTLIQLRIITCNELFMQ